MERLYLDQLGENNNDDMHTNYMFSWNHFDFDVHLMDIYYNLSNIYITMTYI